MGGESIHLAMSEEQRRRLALLLDNIPDRVFFKDEKGRFLEVNLSLANRFKLDSPQQAIGMTDFDLFAESYAELTAKDEQEVMRSGQPIIGKVEKETLRDGGISWALTTKMPLRDEKGRIVGTFGISHDITELKRAELEVRDSEERYHRLRLREVLEDLTKSHEELKDTQLQLIQMERHQLASEIAAGVAHEVKNPLAILQMGIQFFAEQPNIERETADAVLHEMREAVERANSVIEDLLIFSSAREFAMQEASVTSLLEEILRLTRPSLAMSGIRIVANLDPHLPMCRMDPGKIEQVFANVISNASHAMPSGGTLTITATGKTLGGGDVHFEQGDRSGRRLRQSDSAVVIEICDTGTGIPADKLSRVFDPFFTTKKTGKGKGLGLSVSKKIIDLHEGEINIANMQGGGSKVTIVLPCASLCAGA